MRSKTTKSYGLDSAMYNPWAPSVATSTAYPALSRNERAMFSAKRRSSSTRSTRMRLLPAHKPHDALHAEQIQGVAAAPRLRSPLGARARTKQLGPQEYWLSRIVPRNACNCSTYEQIRRRVTV